MLSEQKTTPRGGEAGKAWGADRFRTRKTGRVCERMERSFKLFEQKGQQKVKQSEAGKAVRGVATKGFRVRGGVPGVKEVRGRGAGRSAWGGEGAVEIRVGVKQRKGRRTAGGRGGTPIKGRVARGRQSKSTALGQTKLWGQGQMAGILGKKREKGRESGGTPSGGG